MIEFNVPPYVGNELNYIKDVVEKHKICGDGEYTQKCNKWIEEKMGTAKALLTTSCVKCTGAGILMLAIPDQEGCHIQVDGKKQKHIMRIIDL